MTFNEMLAEIPVLTIEERKQLIAALVDSLVDGEVADSEKTFSILDFEGVGAHLYDGSDAQEDVDRMRAEWDTLRRTH